MSTPDLQHPLLVLGALLGATLMLSVAILRVLAAFAGRSRVLLTLFFLPGVIVHESAHAAACAFTGTRIRRIVLWNGRGGCVEHDRPRWAVLQPVISFAPVLVGLAVLAMAGRQLNEGDWLPNGAWLWLMVSVGATLAPSGEDWRSALVGSAAIFLLVLTLGWARPGWWEILTPPARTLLPHMAAVTGILGAVLVALKLLAAVGFARRR